MVKRFPQAIQDFAYQFVTMQTKRHDADYDPDALFVKSDVQTAIVAVETIIAQFKASNVKDRRAFCAYVLLKKRSR